MSASAWASRTASCGWGFPGWSTAGLGFVGFQGKLRDWLDFELRYWWVCQGLVGFGEFSNLEVDSDLLSYTPALWGERTCGEETSCRALGPRQQQPPPPQLSALCCSTAQHAKAEALWFKAHSRYIVKPYPKTNNRADLCDFNALL